MAYTYLALGDSYTIGEGVPLYDSFPYQTVQLLRKAGQPFYAPEIIARTGWTTDELIDGISRAHLLPAYDFVTLLIGVNNQYRARSADQYAGQLQSLLAYVVKSVRKQAGRAFVLSIPDWSVSSFAHSSLPDAAGRDHWQVAREIDAFNAIARELAEKFRLEFIDITGHSRAATGFAADGLHPAAEQYQYWAEQLAKKILAGLAPRHGQ